MYPKNSASPPRLAIGAIYQIADGVKVVADASVVVRPEGGAEGAGAGSLVVGGTSGVWYYTPTQGESNYTAFCVTVYKADCTTASVNVVTTASATPGIAVCADDQKVDVNTIKTKSVTVDAGGTTFPASIHASGAAVAKSPASLAAADVSGNLPVDVQTVKQRAVTDVGLGNTVYLGTVAWNTVVPDAAGTANALITALASYGDLHWLTATGFVTTTDLDARGITTANVAQTGDSFVRIGATGSGLTSLAPAATALSSVVWTNAKAGYIDAAISGVSGLDAAGVRSALGMASADMDDQLDAILAQATAAAGGLGSGARRVLFTVAGIQGATVRLYRTGSIDRIGQTGTDYTIEFLCDVDATWNYTVTHPLYEGASGTIAVNGNESVPVTLTALSWPESTMAGSVTVRVRVKTKARAWAGSGYTVSMRIREPESTGVGTAWSKGTETQTTNSSGYVYFSNVPIGATVAFLVGTTGEEEERTIASDATTPYEVEDLLGVVD